MSPKSSRRDAKASKPDAPVVVTPHPHELIPPPNAPLPELIFTEATPHERREEVLYRVFEFAPDAILLVTRDGRVAKANEQAEVMFGYPRAELVGLLVEELIPKRYAARHVGFRKGYMGTPRARPMGVGVELFGTRKNGTEFPVDIMLSPLQIEGDPLVIAVVRDATERKRIEAQAREAREMYFKEVHHRVKNNLQVISSLLSLQSTYTSDTKTLEILKESQSRVKSIALLHEKLYRSPDLTRLDFAEYVRDLVADLFRTYAVDQGSLEVRTQIDDVHLEIDTAIPCGLIINELVSNVLKHAFPKGQPGAVDIELEPVAAREYRLTVRDSGVGLPTGFDTAHSSSLGLKLVSDLTRQLDGTVRVTSPPGTEFRVTFKELEYKERR